MKDVTSEELKVHDQKNRFAIERFVNSHCYA